MTTDIFFDTFTAQKLLFYEHNTQCLPLHLKFSFDKLSRGRGTSVMLQQKTARRNNPLNDDKHFLLVLYPLSFKIHFYSSLFPIVPAVQ